MSFLEGDRGALLVAVCISAIIWLLVKLSKDDFITRTEVLFEYNAPSDKLYTSLPPKQMEVWVRGKGFDLLSEHFSRRPNVVRYTLSDAPVQTISSAQLRSKISEVLQGKSLQLGELGMDGIVIQLEPAASKEVPVRLDADIGFGANFQLIDSIRVSPPLVVATGPASLVSELVEQPTQKLVLQGIASSETRAVVPLVPHENPQMTFHPDSVEVVVFADRFTEKTVIVPISVVNNADSVAIFPRTAQLSFRVSLGKFGLIGSDNFAIEADFSKIDPSGNTLPLHVSTVPAFVDNVSIRPKAVEYYFHVGAKGKK